ncbi:hypothetical protein Tco_1185443, partial [Tanacetum coccineum]
KEEKWWERKLRFEEDVDEKTRMMGEKRIEDTYLCDAVAIIVSLLLSSSASSLLKSQYVDRAKSHSRSLLSAAIVEPT